MKIVLTLNELKAGSRMLSRIGIAGKVLNDIVNMEDGQTLNQEQITEMFKFKFDEDTLSNLNKNPNVLSVTKNMTGVGTAHYVFVINEEFLIDSHELYGDLIVETVEQLMTAITSLKVFFKFKIKTFIDKWKLE